jgi:uncharacterized protein YukE
VVAASLCVGVWAWRREGGEAAAPAPAPVVAVEAPKAPPRAAPPPSDPMDEAVEEIQKAEAEYRKAMSDLEKVVAAEKPRWKPEAARAFDANLATIDAAVEKQREAFRLHPQELQALDALQASYRKRIDFLQESLVRGGPAAKETL